MFRYLLTVHMTSGDISIVTVADVDQQLYDVIIIMTKREFKEKN